MFKKAYDATLIIATLVGLFGPAEWMGWILTGVALVIVCSPPSLDPAIRWKEFNMRWAQRLEKHK